MYNNGSMVIKTQTSNMTKALEEQMKLFMKDAAATLGAEAHDLMIALWNDRKGDFVKELTASLTKKRKRSGKKRGKSAYIFFSVAERIKINQDKPELKGKDVMKELGERWAEAKKGDIGKWEQMAVEDKQRVQDTDEVVETDDDDEMGKDVLPAKKKKSGKKKGKSAYIFFSVAERIKIKQDKPDLKGKDVMKELGERWAEAKKGDIGKWERMAADDKQRVQEESDDEVVETVIPVKKKKSSGKKKGKSAYIFFTIAERIKIKQDKPDLKGKDVMKELGERWAEAKKGDIGKWEQMAADDKQRVQEESDDEDKQEERDDVKEEETKKVKKVYAYAFWAKALRDEVAKSAKLKGKELTAELRKRWKGLENAEKDEWKVAAAAAGQEVVIATVTQHGHAE